MLTRRYNMKPPADVLTDADSLIARFGTGAYDEARTRSREARQGRTLDANRPAGLWDKVRHEIGKRTGRNQHVDTATRYLIPNA